MGDTKKEAPWTAYFGTLRADGETDEQKIKKNIWVPCRICERIFNRVRLTALYCYECREGICEGEHGRFHQNKNRFLCIVDDPRSKLDMV